MQTKAGPDNWLAEPRQRLIISTVRHKNRSEESSAKGPLGSERLAAATCDCRARPPSAVIAGQELRGCSSVVEHHVANVDVEGSTPFTRSFSFKDNTNANCG